MELLKQLRVVFVGIPDAGKSTLISYIIKTLYNKVLSPDTLMNELEYSDGNDIYGGADTRTIKSAKIIMPYKDYEIMLIDAPGHIEYKDQIESALNMSSIIVYVNDVNRLEESLNYFHNYIQPYTLNKIFIKVDTHTKINNKDHFNSTKANFQQPILHLLDLIDSYKNDNRLVDIENEARQIVKENLVSFKKSVMMFSGGKDSVVGYNLIKDYVKEVIFPMSGFDFEELMHFINMHYKFVDKKSNIPSNVTYNNTSVFDIHKYKGDFNLDIETRHDVLCINYRCSDEGVRSKDHYIKFGQYAHRFSPVFYFSEENIWRYIAKYNLAYCPLYHKGYRSLGDYPITFPCMPEFDNINDIIDYIHKHPFEERDGRSQQDNSEKYGMEKLRNLGFF